MGVTVERDDVPMITPRTQSMAASFASSPLPDPWVPLFEKVLPAPLLETFLAQGLVDLDRHPDRPTELLAALVRCWLYASADVIQHRLLEESDDGALVAQARAANPNDPSVRDIPQALPSDLKGPWPDPSPATVAGRLVAVGADAFSRTGNTDILDVALKLRWSDLVLTLLDRADRPTAADLSRRSAGLKFERKALPWTHALAYTGRATELAAWLQVPDMDPNQTDETGRTALFYARDAGVVRVLCAAGTNPEHRALDGRTAVGQWENPSRAINFHLRPGVAESLIHTLRAHAGAGPTHGPAERLQQWLKKPGPEDWATLTPEEQSDMVAVRVASAAKKDLPEVQWGAAAYLGLRFGYLYGDKETLKSLAAWKTWVEGVPSAVLEHESVTGVADGWVLLAALYSRGFSSSLGETLEPAIHSLFDVLSERMTGQVPKDQALLHWRLGLLRACAVLKEHANPRENPPQHVVRSLLWMDRDGRRKPWEKNRHPLLTEFQEMGWVVLTSAPLRAILAQEVSAEVGSKMLAAPPLDRPEQALVLWEGLLSVYHQVSRICDNGAREMWLLSAESLHDIMGKWMSAGFIPTGIRDHKIRGALTALEKRGSPIGQNLRALAMGKRLDQSVGVPVPAPVPKRPRM